MRPWLHKIEVVVDKLIPILLIILLFVIIIEFGFHEIAEKYHTVIQVLDWLIVSAFVLDLIFKYLKIRNFPKFLKASWIDILAIFPFFLVFRAFEGLLGVFEATETLTRTQKVVHVGVEIEKEIGMTIKEGERLAQEASRSEKFAKFVDPVSRSFRFFKFGDEETRKETEKQAKEIVKEARKSENFIEKTTDKGIKKVGKEVNRLEEDVEDLVDEVPRHVKAAIFYEKPKIMEFVKDKINKQMKRKITYGNW